MPAALKPAALSREESVSEDPETGDLVFEKVTRRGVLEKRERVIGNSRSDIRALIDAFQSPGKKFFEKKRDELREELKRLGLPTDDPPRWIKLDDGDWQPDRRMPGDPKLENLTGSAPWTYVLEIRTGELTPEWAKGQLLKVILDILARPRADENFCEISRYGSAFYRYKVAGQINDYAQAGIAAHRGRSCGTKARKTKRQLRVGVVRVHAERLWAEKPALRGIASNTAQEITGPVNKELESLSLLNGGKPLAAKTIGDYIRDFLGDSFSSSANAETSSAEPE